MENILKQSQEQQFSYRLWPAIEHDNPVTSCTLAHKQIVKWAKDNEQPSVWIMEDDVMFTAPKAADNFIYYRPVVYCIYTAGMYGTHKFWDRRSGYDYPKSMSGTHCYLVHKRAYDRFLALPEDIHLDLAISNEFGFQNKTELVLAKPMYAIQIPGYSDMLGQIVDYNNDKYLWQFELFKQPAA